MIPEADAELPEGASRIRRFIEKWTLKEAFVKATGRGLKCATKNFSIGTPEHLIPNVLAAYSLHIAGLPELRHGPHPTAHARSMSRSSHSRWWNLSRSSAVVQALVEYGM